MLFVFRLKDSPDVTTMFDVFCSMQKALLACWHQGVLYRVHMPHGGMGAWYNLCCMVLDWQQQRHPCVHAHVSLLLGAWQWRR
jgi:hypothetical protein